MFCTNCGKDCGEGKAFCTACGTPLKKKSPAITVAEDKPIASVLPFAETVEPTPETVTVAETVEPTPETVTVAETDESTPEATSVVAPVPQFEAAAVNASAFETNTEEPPIPGSGMSNEEEISNKETQSQKSRKGLLIGIYSGAGALVVALILFLTVFNPNLPHILPYRENESSNQTSEKSSSSQASAKQSTSPQSSGSKSTNDYSQPSQQTYAPVIVESEPESATYYVPATQHSQTNPNNQNSSSNSSEKPKQISIPNFTGSTEDSARNTCASLGINLTIVREHNNSNPYGRIISQTNGSDGNSVTIHVSAGTSGKWVSADELVNYPASQYERTPKTQYAYRSRTRSKETTTSSSSSLSGWISDGKISEWTTQTKTKRIYACYIVEDPKTGKVASYATWYYNCYLKMTECFPGFDPDSYIYFAYVLSDDTYPMSSHIDLVYREQAPFDAYLYSPASHPTDSFSLTRYGTNESVSLPSKWGKIPLVPWENGSKTVTEKVEKITYKYYRWTSYGSWSGYSSWSDTNNTPADTDSTDYETKTQTVYYVRGIV